MGLLGACFCCPKTAIGAQSHRESQVNTESTTDPTEVSKMASDLSALEISYYRRIVRRFNPRLPTQPNLTPITSDIRNHRTVVSRQFRQFRSGAQHCRGSRAE
jgi:hypothetical protein